MWVCKGEHNGKGLHLEGRVGACGERDEIGLLELLVQGACRTFGIRRVNQAPATNTCARACARACVTVCTYIPRVSHALAQLQKGQIRVAVLYYTVASTHIRLHSKPRRHHQGMDYTASHDATTRAWTTQAISDAYPIIAAPLPSIPGSAGACVVYTCVCLKFANKVIFGSK